MSYHNTVLIKINSVVEEGKGEGKKSNYKNKIFKLI